MCGTLHQPAPLICPQWKAGCRRYWRRLSSIKALMGTLDDPYSGERFERVRNEITARFVTICGSLSPKDFHLLMDCMAREQIRGEQRTLMPDY
jgi:hypothetical protein